MSKFVLHFILFPVLAMALIAVTGCSDLSDQETRQVEVALRDTLISTTESWDMTINLIEDGRKILELKGSHATTISRKDTQVTRIEGPVSIQIFDSSRTVTTHIQSKRAHYFSRQSEIKLYGDVRVNSKNDKTLLTEYLRWSQQKNQATSNRFVIFTSKKDSITGHGFTGSLNLSNYRIHDVSGHFTREQQNDTTSQ